MQVQIWQVNVSCLFPFVSATGWTDQNSQAQRDTPHRLSLQSAPRPGRLTSEHFQRHVWMIHHPIQAATQQQSHQSVVTRFAPCLLILRHVAICLKGFPSQVVLLWSMCADVMGPSPTMTVIKSFESRILCFNGMFFNKCVNNKST